METENPYAKSDAALAALLDARRRLDDVNREIAVVGDTITEMLQSARFLRGQADAFHALESRSAAAQAKLDAVIADAELGKSRVLVAAADDRQRLLDAATQAAGDIINAAHAQARAIAEREATETAQRQAEIARLDGEIADRRSKHNQITAAIAEARARIGA
jgi:hypothetical protein